MVAGAGRSTSASPASVVRTTRWRSVVPQWTTATGVSAGRPAAMSRPAMAARAAMPMRMTRVPSSRASSSQSTPGSVGSPLCPVTTVTEVDTRPVGDRDAGGGRGGERRADPGHHLEVDAGPPERLGLLAAPPEHERVAALQPHHPATGPAVPHQELVDVGLAAPDWPGPLPTSISWAPSRGQVEELRGHSRS